MSERWQTFSLPGAIRPEMYGAIDIAVIVWCEAWLCGSHWQPPGSRRAKTAMAGPSKMPNDPLEAGSKKSIRYFTGTHFDTVTTVTGFLFRRRPCGIVAGVATAVTNQSPVLDERIYFTQRKKHCYICDTEWVSQCGFWLCASLNSQRSHWMHHAFGPRFIWFCQDSMLHILQFCSEQNVFPTHLASFSQQHFQLLQKQSWTACWQCLKPHPLIQHWQDCPRHFNEAESYAGSQGHSNSNVVESYVRQQRA